MYRLTKLKLKLLTVLVIVVNNDDGEDPKGYGMCYIKYLWLYCY